MNKIKVLLIEDDKSISNFITATMDREGYKIMHALNGREGLSLSTSFCPNVILLDLGLPDMDGLEVLQKLRSWSDVPVIIISARTKEQEKVSALDLGADDYLVKPFDVVELLARVEVVLRRFHKRGAQLSAGDVVVDMEARMVTKAGVPVVLTNKEYGLLVLFIQNKNIALFKESLYEKVWGEEYDGDSRTLELHVQRLRKKMGWENQLVAVYKVGYRLEIA